MKPTDVLEHQSRKDLFDYISENPETTFRILKSVFRINDGTLTYHLDRLIRGDLIVQKKKGKERCYVSLDTIHPGNKGRSSGGKELVYQLISEDPGISRKELLQRTRMTKKELTRSVSRLKAERRIWRSETDEGPGYEIITKRKLYDEMMLIIIDRYLKDEIDLDTLKRTKKALEQML